MLSSSAPYQPFSEMSKIIPSVIEELALEIHAVGIAEIEGVGAALRLDLRLRLFHVGDAEAEMVDADAARPRSSSLARFTTS